MVLLDWGFMIRSHRVEFSVMCSGPVMYIHPVRMGVHMLKPNCMNKLSAGVQNERRYLSKLTYLGSAYLP